MNPLVLMLYCLAPLPALVIVALLVNVVAANIIETRATAAEWPKIRARKVQR